MVDGMPVRGLHQVALRATDLDASIAPYRDLLGLRFIARFDPPARLRPRPRLMLEGRRARPSSTTWSTTSGPRARSCAAQASRSRTSRRSSTATTTGRSGPPAWRSGWRSCTTRAGTSSGSRSADPAERSSLLEPGDVGSLARVGLAANQASSISSARAGLVRRRPITRTLASFHRRAPDAVAAREQSGARRAPWLRSTHRYRSSRRALRVGLAARDQPTHVVAHLGPLLGSLLVVVGERPQRHDLAARA